MNNGLIRTASVSTSTTQLGRSRLCEIGRRLKELYLLAATRLNAQAKD